ncbi:MAG: amidase [Actinomycetota bacterium]|nr:amidase [Actinomycetota bacterium]
MALSPVEYARYDAIGLADLVARKEVAPAELLACALDAAEALNPELNALAEVYDDRRGFESAGGRLSGVPTLLKDIGHIEPGRVIEFGSRLARGNRAETATRFLGSILSSGMVPIGRTTSSELAIAGITETAAFGPTCSPWDKTRSSGGSSGGAGSAVGAGIVPIAQGSDGGGSIRIPASCCGVVGLKPTRGRISPAPYGHALAGFAASFVLTRTVRDTALALDLFSGSAPGDPTPLARPGSGFLDQLEDAPEGLRIAIAMDSFSGHHLDPQVVRAARQTAELLMEMGHKVEIRQPRLPWEPFLRAMSLMWAADAGRLANLLGERTGRPVDETTLERQTLAICREGMALSADDLLQADETFNAVNRGMADFFDDCDILVTPTLGQLPPPIGRYNPDEELDSVSFFGSWADVESFLPLFNCTGQPAISLPLATTQDGKLPIGIQLVGSYGDEALVLRLARALEVAAPWSGRTPPIHVSERMG